MLFLCVYAYVCDCSCVYICVWCVMHLWELTLAASADCTAADKSTLGERPDVAVHLPQHVGSPGSVGGR